MSASRCFPAAPGSGFITPDDPRGDVLGTPLEGTDRHGLQQQAEDNDGKAHAREQTP